ncbi:MAG TPA: sulfatase-like hydrolase/transferase [Gemmatimonadales bacterium]|nr:sulfatase-like hydrolase/transferase [Gemmatimonadales bacterium]
MRSSLRLLLLAVWFGLLAGVIEIIVVQLALRSGVPVRLSADYVWMAPVADVGFALVAVLAALGLARLRRGWDAVALGVGALGFFLAASAALQIESLHHGAVLLLAVGVGVQAARFSHSPRWRRLFALVGPTALVMAAYVVFQGVSARRTEARRETEALSALPAPAGGAMNVLLLILDTVREQSTGLDDSASSRTPALRAFARRGVTFDMALAPAPWTLPSHASFFTGRQLHEHGANWGVPLDNRFPTLAEYLAARGYVTAGFVGNLQFATRASGLARGFLRYDDYQASLGQTVLSSSIGRALAGTTWLRRVFGNHELLNRRHARDVADAFLAWQAQEVGRPFFAFVNFFDAHEPYFPEGRSGSILRPGPKWTRYEHVVGLHSGDNAWIEDKWTLSAPDVAIHAGAYQRAVSEADDALGRLLAELERRGTLANTLVIVAGDHGEQLGEHRLFEHINSLYLTPLHVPLVIASPRLPQGIRVPGPVSLTDLPATVVDLLGLAAGAPFPGRSLLPLGAPSETGDTVLSELKRGLVRQGWYPIGKGPDMYSLVTASHHYIRNGDNSEELYDLVRDPLETRNLAPDGMSQPLLLRFRARLGVMLAPTPARAP